MIHTWRPASSLPLIHMAGAHTRSGRRTEHHHPRRAPIQGGVRSASLQQLYLTHGRRSKIRTREGFEDHYHIPGVMSSIRKVVVNPVLFLGAEILPCPCLSFCSSTSPQSPPLRPSGDHGHCSIHAPGGKGGGRGRGFVLFSRYADAARTHPLDPEPGCNYFRAAAVTPVLDLLILSSSARDPKVDTPN